MSEDSAQQALVENFDNFGKGGSGVPLTAKYFSQRAADFLAQPQGELTRCLPAGMPGLMNHPMMHEYLITPGRVTMLFEDGEVRRIYMDGRAHLPLADLTDSAEGDSIGHWEGGSLIVDTIGMPKGELFMNFGMRVTRNTHVVERLTRQSADVIQIETTVTDPEMLTKPYTYRRAYQRLPHPMAEPRCSQGNRDTGGHVDLTPPPLAQ